MVSLLGHTIAMVGGGCLLGDWKNWFTGVFALFNSTDAPLYSKNYLVLSQNALSTEDFIFIWFLANGATIFHIFVTVVKKMLYCYILLWHFSNKFWTLIIVITTWFSYMLKFRYEKFRFKKKILVFLILHIGKKC